MAFLIDDIFNAIGGHKAAQAQQDQVRKAQGLTTDEYNQAKSWQVPYYQGGNTAMKDLVGQLEGGNFLPTVNPQNLQNDPGYQFRMQQAQQALSRSAASKGMLNSGAFAKGLDQYSQGLASQEYQNAWQRQMDQGQSAFQRLFNVAGMGQQSAQYLGNLSGNYTNNMDQLYGAMGNASAAQQQAAYGGIGSGIGSLGNIGMLAAGGAFGGGGLFGGGGMFSRSSPGGGLSSLGMPAGGYQYDQPNMIPTQGYGGYQWGSKP